MTDLAAIKAKITALLTKRVDRGCTESEALSAATVAARLMAEHGLDEDDLDISEAELVDEAPDALWQGVLSYTIASCTGTERLYGRRRKDGTPLIVFKGKTPGPEIAAYLRDVCFRAVDSAVRSYEGGLIHRSIRGESNRGRASRAFTEAMIHRLSERLRDIFGDVIAARIARQPAETPETDPSESPSRSLIRRSHAGFLSERSTAARLAGHAAADSVSLNRGVDRDAEVRRIGRG